jgi:hypothetical protein
MDPPQGGEFVGQLFRLEVREPDVPELQDQGPHSLEPTLDVEVPGEPVLREELDPPEVARFARLVALD